VVQAFCQISGLTPFTLGTKQQISRGQPTHKLMLFSGTKEMKPSQNTKKKK